MSYPITPVDPLIKIASTDSSEIAPTDSSKMAPTDSSNIMS